MQTGRQVDERTDRQSQSIFVTVRTRLKLFELCNVTQQNEILTLLF